MAREFAGKIELDIRDSVPDWEPFLAPKAPEGAPNVLFVVWDDVGYGTMDCFGGPVETPKMRRIADMGVRYSNFHTTALCSPTRASLLTGRNATSNGMATIAEFSSGFPGISTRIPFENGFISEVLVEHGYNTYCVGKWHLTPGEETAMAAYKGRWPLGRGFERFYGFLGGESNCWYPDLVHDNHQIEPPATPEDGYHLAEGPLGPGDRVHPGREGHRPRQAVLHVPRAEAGHAPHHVFAEWADKYKGAFDEGYEAIRDGILARQKELGLLPDDTELSPINPHGEPGVTGPDGQPWPLLDTVRPWDSLSDDEQRLFARMAEVFAGYVSYTDDQVGRVIDYLEASGSSTTRSSSSSRTTGRAARVVRTGRSTSGGSSTASPTPTDLTLQHIDELGSPQSYNHYNTGWAWAFDTPFPYWKRWAGYEGGVADMCLVSRGRRRSLRRRRHAQQYVHAVDVVPTIYDLLGIDAAGHAQGLRAEPDRGRELRRVADRPEGSRQVDAVLRDARAALDLPRRLARLHRAPAALSGWGKFDLDVWELYHLEVDRSQSKNVAAQEPERLERLKARWF